MEIPNCMRVVSNFSNYSRKKKKSKRYAVIHMIINAEGKRNWLCVSEHSKRAHNHFERKKPL